MNGGNVPFMFMLVKFSSVTEPSVQAISGQVQCDEFDAAQWLMGGGFCQCCFSFSRTACSRS